MDNKGHASWRRWCAWTPSPPGRAGTGGDPGPAAVASAWQSHPRSHSRCPLRLPLGSGGSSLRLAFLTGMPALVASPHGPSLTAGWGSARVTCGACPNGWTQKDPGPFAAPSCCLFAVGAFVRVSGRRRPMGPCAAETDDKGLACAVEAEQSQDPQLAERRPGSPGFSSGLKAGEASRRALLLPGGAALCSAHTVD